MTEIIRPSYGHRENVELSELLGVTLSKITGAETLEEQIVFTDETTTWWMFHEQDCCESVVLEEVIGDISDLIGSPILRAEKVTSKNVESEKPDACDDSWTWTFYKLATIKGEVVLRWLGSSNGYYSEEVYFYKEI